MAKSTNVSIEELMAELAASRAQNAAMAEQLARKAKKPGWYTKTVKESKKTGRKGRCSFERVHDNGVVSQFYVGHLGKLQISSGYGTGGQTVWENEREAFLQYCENGGLRADLAQIPTGAKGWGDDPTPAKTAE